MEGGYIDDEENFEIIEEIELDDEGSNAGKFGHMICQTAHMATHVLNLFPDGLIGDRSGCVNK